MGPDARGTEVLDSDSGEEEFRVESCPTRVSCEFTQTSSLTLNPPVFRAALIKGEDLWEKT